MLDICSVTLSIYPSIYLGLYIILKINKKTIQWIPHCTSVIVNDSMDVFLKLIWDLIPCFSNNSIYI